MLLFRNLQKLKKQLKNHPTFGKYFRVLDQASIKISMSWLHLFLSYYTFFLYIYILYIYNGMA